VVHIGTHDHPTTRWGFEEAGFPTTEPVLVLNHPAGEIGEAALTLIRLVFAMAALQNF
jgi:hypothetical protein